MISLLRPETLFGGLYIGKYYLAVSTNSLAVLNINEGKFSIVDVIIEGSDFEATVCEFDSLDEMLDAISIIAPIIRNTGHIHLEQHFFIH